MRTYACIRHEMPMKLPELYSHEHVSALTNAVTDSRLLLEVAAPNIRTGPRTGAQRRSLYKSLQLTGRGGFGEVFEGNMLRNG